MSGFEGCGDGGAVHDVLAMKADGRDRVGGCVAGAARRGCVFFDGGWGDAAVVGSVKMRSMLECKGEREGGNSLSLQ